ncbi:MAG: VanZ family protein [Gemmatimonadetes bacterium]|nr:VanZ family protein [Gemmatimonadota bacterium]NNK48825.1 VanZ family protein [Gemmatimonadota bacterium]
MSLFTSDRERRLWFWTLAVVLAIYATLGLTPKLAGALRDSDQLQAVLFIVAMFLVGATVVTQGLKLRPGGAEIGVALGIAAVYLMLFVRMALAERSHLIEYGVVAVFIHEALRERARQGRRVPVPAFLAVVAASLVGVLDESIQVFLPNRVFDPRDIGFNVLAGLMAVLASLILTWARRRGGNFRRNWDR